MRTYYNASSMGREYSRLTVQPGGHAHMKGVALDVCGRSSSLLLNFEQCRDLAAQLLAIAGPESPKAEPFVVGTDFTK